MISGSYQKPGERHRPDVRSQPCQRLDFELLALGMLQEYISGFFFSSHIVYGDL